MELVSIWCNFVGSTREASSDDVEEANLRQNEIKGLSNPCAGLERT